MTEEELVRYSRHILLKELGEGGQEKIRAAHVLIVGAGGLGCPAALYLTSAGVGKMTIVDGDVVDLTNLQRQILHTHERIGKAKVLSAQETLSAINPEVSVNPVHAYLDDTSLGDYIAKADVVLDCSDNFATRHAINRVCKTKAKPLVSGSAVHFSGQLSVYDFRDESNPCYCCLFPECEGAEEIRCNRIGVFAPLTGIIGSMQAAEAIKAITGIGQLCVGRLLLLDGLSMAWRSVKFSKDPHCPVCKQTLRA